MFIPSSSEIYCQGQLLHTVQMKEIYTDSKTFVDMKMKGKPKETLEAFNAFMAEKNNDPSREELKAWVESNFEKPGAEFEDWIPDDWVANPAFLKHIKDADLREFASKLNQIWHELGRKMIADVAINSDQYSIIPVDHPVIVPGGRFREFYYWDSYWIVKGLLLSEMKKVRLSRRSSFQICYLQLFSTRLPAACWRTSCPSFSGTVSSRTEVASTTACARSPHSFALWSKRMWMPPTTPSSPRIP